MKPPRSHFYLLRNRMAVPCAMEEWALEFGNDGRVVELTHVGPLDVSTVFLGLDHNFRPPGPPILFETMIFGDDRDEYQTRCSTYDDAVKMHAAAVEVARQILAKADAAIGPRTEKAAEGEPPAA